VLDASGIGYVASDAAHRQTKITQLFDGEGECVRLDISKHHLQIAALGSPIRGLLPLAGAPKPGVRARVMPGCNLGQTAEVMGPAFRMVGA
jgi:hypothetical protein